jgi:ABC-2 type transport system permease protein
MSALSTGPVTAGAPTTPVAAPPSPSFATVVMLVGRREVLSQVRSKSFVVSTVVLLLLVLAGIVVPKVAGSHLESVFGGGPAKVAVVAATEGALDGLDAVTATPVADEDAARAAVRDGSVDAALVPSAGSPTGVALLVEKDAPGGLVDKLSLRPDVEVLGDGGPGDALRFLVPFAFGIVFLMAAMGSGMMIAQNTVTEKQTRIVEILLAAVPARALMAGKILGNSALAIGQVAAIASVAVLGLVLTGQDAVLTALGAPVSWFLAFFILGFVLIAAIFAAAGSLVSRVEDVGAVVQPAVWITMVPYFGVIFFASNETVMTVLSYIPFATPVAMPVRLFFGDAAWWEPLVALALLVVTTAAVAALAARIYTRTLLRTGQRIPWREALRSR